MKKLIEASGDYSFENSDQVKASVLRKAFNAGAEFVQRWIPVEEELPEHSSHLVIPSTLKGLMPPTTQRVFVKTDLGNYYENKRLKMSVGEKDWVWFVSMEGEVITHWRPIEIK